MPLFSRPLIVCDTETTGFPGQAHAYVVELGFVVLDVEGNVSSTYETLVNPGVPYHPNMYHALNVNGIPWGAIESAPYAHVVANTLNPWFASFPHFAVAFPTHFDQAMCDGMGLHALAWHAEACVKKAAGKGTLEFIARKYGALGKEERQLHRALADARITSRIAVELAKAGKLVV